MLVFFFKQKTAYEMRISDWSSDVCSSDLLAPLAHKPLGRICRSVPCTRHERGRAQGALLQNREDRCAGVIQISGGRSTKSPDGFPSPTPGSGENRLEHVLLGCR